MKISEEIARKDFDRWFESKRLSSTYKSEAFEAIEKQMIEAICDGYMIINEDNTITLKLAWSLSLPSGELTELNFVHRIQTSELVVKTAYAKDNQQKKLTATIAAITGQVGGTILALDQVDYMRAGNIAAYFFV